MSSRPVALSIVPVAILFSFPPAPSLHPGPFFGVPQASTHAPVSSQPAAVQAADINSTSVTANFDKLMLDGQGHMSFFYTLQNHTTQTILIQSSAAVTIAALTRNPTSGQVDQIPLDNDHMHIPYPISMAPGHAVTLVMRDVSHIYSNHVPIATDPNPADLARYEVRLRALVRKHAPRLEGYVLTDSSLHLRIDLPRTW
jgi:hypothetical protein